jgi:surface polysaccharide O-acyltransferase-like enzyme
VIAVVWIRELEFLRAFAILAVVAVHVSMFFTSIPDVNLLAVLNAGIFVTAHFAVPIFIFVSGLVLATRYRGGYALFSYYSRRAWTIVPPYLLFTFLYLLIPVEGMMHLAGTPAPDTALYALLLGTGAYHLWFFVLIIQLYLLYPLIFRVYERFEQGGGVLYLLLLLLFVQTVWNVSAHAVGAFAGTDWYTILIRAFPSHLFYFVLGIAVAVRFDSVSLQVRSLPRAFFVVPVVAGTLLLAGMWAWGMFAYGGFYAVSPAFFCIYRLIEPFYYIPVGIALFRLAGHLQESGGWWCGACRSIGHHSYGIYLIHPFVLAAAATILASYAGLGWSDWITYPVVFVATVAASYGAVRALSRLPGSAVVVGEPRRESSYD